jgi:predicted nuclease of restriction endonuclease-like (RecB) superfamily
MQISKNEYQQWLTEIKSRIRVTQIKAAMAVNSQLIAFYWELGKSIYEKENVWGSKLLVNLSNDLKHEFPEMSGFSVTNLKYCKLFYSYFQMSPQLGDELKSPRVGDEILLQNVYKIPWGHIKLLISKIKKRNEILFYIQQTIENNWSRNVLELQIKSQLFERQGKAISNFKDTLPQPFSDLAQQTLKDPYVFDFMQLSNDFREKDIENQLIIHIQKFLLELGKGFAFVGRQYHLQVADNDYYIDLLFYHIKLKCYVVLELKNTKFIPEYAGKLNFYLSAIDSLLKDENDKPTIGIILCKDKSNIEAEFALRDINKPMGVSEFELIQQLPPHLKSSLPTIEEIENELNK